MKTTSLQILLLLLLALIPTISIYTYASKKESTAKTTQQSIRIQEQNNKYLNIIGKHSVKTPELPKRANGDINWPEINWFQEIILPKDYEIYKHIVKELVDNGEIPPANELKPKTRLLRDRETMNYYEIPEDIQELVEQKKYDEIPVFAKIKKIKNEKNKIQTQNKGFSTLEINENPSSQVTSSPGNTSKKEQNSKTSGEGQQGNSETSSKGQEEKEIKIININETPKIVIKKLISSKNIEKEDIKITIKKEENKKQKGYKIQTSPEKIIEYYEGIYDNTTEATLYYLSNTQNTDGSFGYKNKYENTSQIVSILRDYNKTNNNQYTKAVNYLKNTSPENNKQKAIKTRQMFHIGEEYQDLLDEILNKQKNDGSFAFDDSHTYGDIATTLETIKTIWEINRNSSEITSSLLYTLSQIREEADILNTGNYHLINKITQYLKPFENGNITKSGSTIKIKDKIEILLNYLDNNYSLEEEKLTDSQDITDEIMTLQTFKLYDKEEEKQEILRENAKLNQNFNGSFGDSYYSTIEGVNALSQTDLEITDIESTGELVSKGNNTFKVKLRNVGYTPIQNFDIHLFIDGFYRKKFTTTTLMKAQEEIEITLDLSSVISLIDDTQIKIYVQEENENNYENNWITKNFTFLPATDGTPVPPLYFSVESIKNRAGYPYIWVNWNKKNDPNRDRYVIIFKKTSEPDSKYFGLRLPSSDDSSFGLHGFVEGELYDIMVGVINEENIDSIHVDSNFGAVQVYYSSEPILYAGYLSGYVTGGIKGYGLSITKKHDRNYIERKTDDKGNFSFTGFTHGNHLLAIKDDKYEPLITNVLVKVGENTENVNLFTHLKDDSIMPEITGLSLTNLENNKIIPGQNTTISFISSDNIAVKEADFYYFNPDEDTWIYLGTQEPINNSHFNFDWYIPEELYGRGYKIKVIVYDFRKNSSETEWGPFEIIDTNDYIPPILDYFEIYEHGYMYSYDIPFFARMGKELSIVIDTKDNEVIKKIKINYRHNSTDAWTTLFTDTNDAPNFTKTYKYEIPTDIEETNEAQIQVILEDDSGNETTKESRQFSIYSSRIQGDITLSSNTYKVGTEIGFDITNSSDYNLRSARVYLDCGTKREKVYEQYDNSGINISGPYTWDIPNNNYVFRSCYLELTLEDIHGSELKKLSENFSIIADTELPTPFDELIDIYIEDFSFPGDARIKTEDKQIEHVKIDDTNISHTIITHSYEYYRNTDSGVGNDTYVRENNKYYLSYNKQTATLSPKIKITDKNYDLVDLEIVGGIPYVLLEKVDNFDKYNQYAYTYKNGNSFVNPIFFGNPDIPSLKTFTKISSSGKIEMGRVGEYAIANSYIWKLDIYSNRIERYPFSNGNVGNGEISQLSGYSSSITNHYIKPAVDGDIIYFIGFGSSKLIKLDTSSLTATDYNLPFSVSSRDEAYKTSMVVKNSKLYIFGNGRVYALENGTINQKSDITYTFGNDTTNYSNSWNDVEWSKAILAEEKIYLIFGEYLYSAKPSWTYFEILEFDTNNNTFTKNIAKTRNNLSSYEYQPDFHYIGNDKILITYNKYENLGSLCLGKKMRKKMRNIMNEGSL